MVRFGGIVTGTVPVPPFASALANETRAPPAGAAADSVTVAVADWPPATDVGSMLNNFGVVAPPGVISNSACCPGLPGKAAKMFRLNCEVTGDVPTVNSAVVAPAGTTTL